MNENVQLARLFTEMATLLELQQANPFRIRAYQRAAQVVEALGPELIARADAGTLEEMPGIGRDLAARIQEFLSSGRLTEHDELHARTPPVLLEMIRIPGLGPRRARQLLNELGVETLEQLETACRTGSVAALNGFGARSQEKILEGIDFVRRTAGRLPLGKVLPVAESLLADLQNLETVRAAGLAGSVRRMKETVADIDLVAASTDPEPVMAFFTSHPQAVQVTASGPTRSTILTEDDLSIDLRVVEPAVWGATLLHFTGSREHNVRLRERAIRRGLKLSEYGLFEEAGDSETDSADVPQGRCVAAAEEAECYAALGLAWIPPELREDRGEIQAAEEGTLPELVGDADIRGELHAHTDWSDGRQTLDELIEACRELGYMYVAVTDHSRSLKIAHGLEPDRLQQQIERVREADARYDDITVLAGSEVDILRNGDLDYPDDLLAQLDLVIASVHTHFTLAEHEQTRRICRAMENPLVTILGHPTGRLLGERDPYPVDMEAVLECAARTRTAIEINANPRRLDLNDRYARRARQQGVELVITTDAHRPSQLAYMRYGVRVARRAWMGPSELLNTRPPASLRAALDIKRM